MVKKENFCYKKATGFKEAFYFFTLLEHTYIFLIDMHLPNSLGKLDFSKIDGQDVHKTPFKIIVTYYHH